MIVLRWFAKMFYVASTKKTLPEYRANKYGGTTVSILKRGGLQSSWNDAKILAGWVSNEV